MINSTPSLSITDASSSHVTAASASSLPTAPVPIFSSPPTSVDALSSIGDASSTSVSGQVRDLSGITLSRINEVMSHKQWSGDADDKFIKRLSDPKLSITYDEALAVLICYHNDTEFGLSRRIGDMTSANLKKVCDAIKLASSAFKKKDAAILVRNDIIKFVSLHAFRHPSIVMPNTNRLNSSAAAPDETSEGEEDHDQVNVDESGDEQSSTPPPPRNSSSHSQPRASPRSTKGVRAPIVPPGSKSTTRRALDFPSSKLNQPVVSGLSADVLAALGALPARIESADRDGLSHKSKGSLRKKKVSSSRRDHTSESDSTDSDSDGPSSRSSRINKGKEEKKKGKERKKKKHTRRSRSRSRSDHSRHHRRHRSITSSSSDSSSDLNDSSSSSDLTSDSTDDSDSGHAVRHHHRSRSSRDRPLFVFTPSRRGDADDVHDGINSLRLTQPLAKAFLNNVYRTSKSVHVAYEKIDFKQTRNQRECLVLARVIDLLQKKKYKQATESLVRRLAGVHTSDSTGDWNYSDAYELDMSKQSFVPDDFAAYAAKSVGRMSSRDSKIKSTRTNVKSSITRSSNDRAVASSASTNTRDPTTKSTSAKSNGKQRGENGSRKK